MSKDVYLLNYQGIQTLRRMKRRTKRRDILSIQIPQRDPQPRKPNPIAEAFGRLTTPLGPNRDDSAQFKVYKHAADKGEFELTETVWEVWPGIHGKHAWYPAGCDIEVHVRGALWFLKPGCGYTCLVGTLAGDLVGGETAEVNVPDLPEAITTKPEVHGYGIDEGKKFVAESPIGINREQSKGEWVIDWIEGCPVDAE